MKSLNDYEIDRATAQRDFNRAVALDYAEGIRDAANRIREANIQIAALIQAEET